MRLLKGGSAVRHPASRPDGMRPAPRAHLARCVGAIESDHKPTGGELHTTWRAGRDKCGGILAGLEHVRHIPAARPGRAAVGGTRDKYLRVVTRKYEVDATWHREVGHRRRVADRVPSLDLHLLDGRPRRTAVLRVTHDDPHVAMVIAAGATSLSKREERTLRRAGGRHPRHRWDSVAVICRTGAKMGADYRQWQPAEGTRAAHS